MFFFYQTIRTSKKQNRKKCGGKGLAHLKLLLEIYCVEVMLQVRLIFLSIVFFLISLFFIILRFSLHFYFVINIFASRITFLFLIFFALAFLLSHQFINFNFTIINLTPVPMTLEYCHNYNNSILFVHK